MTRADKEKDIAMSWCLKNNIIVVPEAIDNSFLKLVIHFKKKPPIIGEKIYPSKKIKHKDDKWWEEIANIYIAYYNKLNK